MMKRWILLMCFLLLFAAQAQAQAQVIWQDENQQVQVVSTNIRGEEWLFLPSGTDLSRLSLTENGQTRQVDWLAQAEISQEYPGVYTGAAEQTGETLHVAVSSGVRSLHLYSADPVNYGREWVEDCSLHQKETTGRIVMLGLDGRVELKQNLFQLRGRGNSTWRNAVNKRPFQFKLEYRADVLKTGLAEEYAATWVLLANEQDYTNTMLRNQISLDLAKELGLEETSRCEQVDLYYDGDYRGTYLLAEKVEVGSHGVDVKDFDKLLKPVNEKFRSPIPDELPSPTNYGAVHPVPKGKTEKHGADYAYSQGVYDNRDVAAGGYLLELDHYGTLSEQAWFQLPTGYYVSFKNPEYAGDRMVQYVAEKFLDAYETMINLGYHPDTDEPLETFVDIDSFTRSHLVSELMYNSNTYYFSSTYFVLPEGEERIYAGPLWDFDHHVNHSTGEDTWPALKDNNVFSHAFYRTTAFQRAAKEIMRDEVAPVYENVLFGSGEGAYLKSFEAYKETLRTSWYLNAYRFSESVHDASTVETLFEHSMDGMEQFLKEQHEFLQEEIAQWGEDDATTLLEVECILPYAAKGSEVHVKVIDEPHGSLFLENANFECIEEATEDSFAVWQLTLAFLTKLHAEIADEVTIVVNGEEFLCENEGGKVLLTLQFEDPSYRPALLDGVDYGYVFNYEYYLDSYPELMDEYGDDREAVLRYFVEEGMDMGDCANEFLDPMMVFEYVAEPAQWYETDWRAYYEAFMETPGIWMTALDATYEPEFFEP